MSNVSLTANILTSKVITGNADRLQTYRIQDSDAMMCPVWNGQDLTGRQACEYSFYTKRAGCNSAMDRIVVENFLRPTYTNFVTTNAAGIAGYVYETPVGNNFQKSEEQAARNQRSAAGRSTGHFGYGSAANGPYLPGNVRQELNGVLGGPSQNPIAPSAQAYALGSQQQRFNAAGSIAFKNYSVPNINNATQRVQGVNYSVDPNKSYFPSGASRSATYANESQFKSYNN
jgi:hypothetical protein